MRIVKSILLSSIAMGAFMPVMAYAQNAAEEAASEGGEIIVTARRQSERLQDVPASIMLPDSHNLHPA
jgi:iron complex outermembrane recepter protein